MLAILYSLPRRMLYFTGYGVKSVHYCEIGMHAVTTQPGSFHISKQGLHKALALSQENMFSL